MYTIKNIAKSKDEVSWCCVKRDCALKCTAVLKTNKEYTDAMPVKEHNHPADVTGVSVEKCRHSMKSTASTANDKPNQILSFAAVPDEVQARLPAAETIKRVLRCVHANHQPKDPNTPRELIIEGQWSQTSGNTQMLINVWPYLPLQSTYNNLLHVLYVINCVKMIDVENVAQ